MAIKKIIENVCQISLGAVNCFIIDNDGLTLVDTGFPGSEKKIFDALSEIGKRPIDIKQIILTHLHPDHAGAAADIQKLLQIPIYAHSTDARLIRKGVGGREPMARTRGFFPWLIFNLFMRNAKSIIKPVDSVMALQGGQLLPILSGVRVIHSPGHSEGHISLLLEKEQVLIAGDICGNMGGLSYSILYEDPVLAKQTLKEVAKYNFDIACFGHGNPLLAGANKKIAEKFK
ncbi:MBL fold metallo-hydrolase [Mucilaginibacter sp. OK283]|uniref:MBL fold metallo-hydrolase n=1 Tax=Mucilaginibacter sp. OK283 TaxID=1881049 RepID=UPI0008BBE95B|nr:MBL fold metallo-hydrolase [Mucilaginibacter sp. OK283]SEO51750.1 Glyoxylase, beta-lactamase superfamily II [Mucilaginibacter sp. OK283]